LGKVAERGLTLIPLRLYFKEGRAKLELGLARGKKLHDKRDSIREREVRREIQKESRARQRA
jgi:SsrA-binding protein